MKSVGTPEITILISSDPSVSAKEADRLSAIGLSQSPLASVTLMFGLSALASIWIGIFAVFVAWLPFDNSREVTLIEINASPCHPAGGTNDILPMFTEDTLQVPLPLSVALSKVDPAGSPEIVKLYRLSEPSV